VIRVVLPQQLRTLAGVTGEIKVAAESPVSLASVLDGIEIAYPRLKGTLRDQETKKRRALVRFFACGKDFSNEPPETLLPPQVAAGTEPFLIVGAIAGG
jgi:molybdopterin synthase sulfur carrier subunit